MHTSNFEGGARGRRPASVALLTLAAGVLVALAASGCTCDGGGGGGSCLPRTCAEAGANCGLVDDGCGGTLSCGFCGGGSTCGGGGVPNTCGGSACVADTCVSAGAVCGTVSDGCGGSLRCGYCAGISTCGGGGQAFQCGVASDCVPRTCAEAGAECGRLGDGCGGVLQCGSCTPGEVCGGGGANVCGPTECVATDVCTASDCGLISDGCADVVDCGGCEGGLTCWRGVECRNVSGAIGTPCTSDDACAAGVCLGSASGSWPQGYCTTWCSGDDDCGTGAVCVSSGGRGVCEKACGSDLDCSRAGYQCLDPDRDGRRTCQPSGTGDGGVGDPCTSLVDCAGGGSAVCISPTQGMPEGYCTVSCSATAACPSGSHCAFTSGSAVCLSDCTSASDCRSGYACTDYDGDGATECAPAAGGGDGCTSDADCGTGTCLSEGASGWPGGYCTTGCTSDADCPTGLVCAADSVGQQWCLEGCTSSRDCRPGYACVSAGGPAPVCAPYGGGTAPVGDPCTSVADCAGAESATCIPEGLGYPGGYCTRACTTAVDCDAGQVCDVLPGGGDTLFCQSGCTSDSDCRSGYVCDTSTSTRCVPDDLAGGSGESGAACEDFTDCAQAGCLTESSTGWRDGYCSAVCQDDSECEGDAHCGWYGPVDDTGARYGVCLQNCGAGCREGYNCWDMDHDGRNECAGWAGGPGVPGDACRTIDQCGGGAVGRCTSEAEGWPGGYCTRDCTSGGCPTGSTCGTVGLERLCLDSLCCAQYVPCSVDHDLNDSCPTGLECVISVVDPDGGGTGLCAGADLTCSPTRSCPPGYLCSDDRGGQCLKCDSGNRCRDDYECYDGTGDGVRECWPAGKGSGGPGTPCTTVADCSGGVRSYCLQGQVTWLPDGYCTWDCSLGDACPSGSVCSDIAVTIPDYGTEHFHYCLDRCSSQADCRDGYDCMTVDPRQGPVCFRPIE